MPSAPAVADHPPTRWGAGLFWLKTRTLQARRAIREAGAPRRFQTAPAGPGGTCLAESRSALFPSEAGAEFALQVGKAQNLRMAAAFLDGINIPSGEVFSFWAHVPRPTRRRGFSQGRELREGCIVPSIGGGLCQLSNALYDIALTARCEIVERHAHSRQVPGSMAEAGRDATIFWNYVDLRFRPAADCRLEVRLTSRELIVRLWGNSVVAGTDGTNGTHGTDEKRESGAVLSPVESCETCGVVACFRHIAPSAEHAGRGIAAWLVDAWWPEFDAYLRQYRHADDWLFLPLRGGRYRWNAEGFARLRQAPFETLRRSVMSRRLAAQGAERQRALLQFDKALAQRYARQLPDAALHLVVSQTLLPHLWRAGVLGGRTFDVLMTRLPIRALEETLNRAAARHPESATLADFRAPPALAAAESAALAEARHWITPHSAIARLAGPHAVKLPWELAAARGPSPADGTDILFPASTLGRKGAYEMAAAARELNLRIQLAGPVLEARDFWRGVDTASASPNYAGVAAVVLPAWAEHQPRALLAAAASGVPVIATEGCGLENVPGVTTIPEGDVAALREALLVHLRHGERTAESQFA